MSEIKENLKKWIDCNVNDGDCRKGAVNDRIIFTPDDLYELIDELYEDEVEPKVEDLERQLEEAREVQNKLGEWVSNYAHCMKTVDYCGSLEDALEMEQYLYELKEKGDE